MTMDARCDASGSMPSGTISAPTTPSRSNWANPWTVAQAVSANGKGSPGTTTPACWHATMASRSTCYAAVPARSIGERAMPSASGAVLQGKTHIGHSCSYQPVEGRPLCRLGRRLPERLSELLECLHHQGFHQGRFSGKVVIGSRFTNAGTTSDRAQGCGSSWW